MVLRQGFFLSVQFVMLIIPIRNKKCIFVGRVLTRHVGLKPDLRKKINVVSIANWNYGACVQWAHLQVDCGVLFLQVSRDQFHGVLPDHLLIVRHEPLRIRKCSIRRTPERAAVIQVAVLYPLLQLHHLIIEISIIK